MVREFDPFDAEQAHDNWELYAELREEGPVVRVGEQMHYVPRHDACREVLLDTDAFSNASGMKAPGVEIPPNERLLGELDPPRHTVVRKVMMSALTPKMVRRAEPFIEQMSAQLLEAVPDSGTADLVAQFTVPLPNRVTVHMLGMPQEDADQLAVWAKSLMESTFPSLNRTERGEGFAGAFPEFAGYIDDWLEKRRGEVQRGEAPDDVTTGLLAVEEDGEPLPQETLRALVRNLITGGLTTTSQLLGNLLHTILTDDDIAEAVRASDEALTTAIEESLRLSPPVMFVARGCVEDTQVQGCPVSAGERVVVGHASANRDARMFDDPDEFRLDRANAAHHLTFGHGPHFCPGAGAARTVARLGIRAFLDRFPPGSIELEPDYEFENVPTFFEIGPRRLPVRTS